MARDVARDWMWSEACEMLARAERMHRELFRPAGTQARLPAWEPPVDILETEFDTPEGCIRVIDFMPLSDERWDVVRIVEGVSGRVAAPAAFAHDD